MMEMLQLPWPHRIGLWGIVIALWPAIIVLLLCLLLLILLIIIIVNCYCYVYSMLLKVPGGLWAPCLCEGDCAWGMQYLQSAEAAPHSAALPNQGFWQSPNGSRNNFDVSLPRSPFLCPLGSYWYYAVEESKILYASFLWFCITTPRLLHKYIY